MVYLFKPRCAKAGKTLWALLRPRAGSVVPPAAQYGPLDHDGRGCERPEGPLPAASTYALFFRPLAKTGNSGGRSRRLQGGHCCRRATVLVQPPWTPLVGRRAPDLCSCIA